MDVAAQMADQWAKEDKKETSRNKSDESLGNLINGKYLQICTEVTAHLTSSQNVIITEFKAQKLPDQIFNIKVFSKRIALFATQLMNCRK